MQARPGLTPPDGPYMTRLMRRSCVALLLLGGCLAGGGDAPKPFTPPEGKPVTLRTAVAYSPALIQPEQLGDLLPEATWVPVYGSMDPLDLRARLAAGAPELIVLLDGAPKFTVRAGVGLLQTDAPYEDLNGDGTPGTPVTRLYGGIASIRDRLSGRVGVPGQAALLFTGDVRVHTEALLLTDWLSELGYTVSLQRSNETSVLAEPGGLTPLALLDGEAVAGLSCGFRGGWDIPSRYNNEMLEHVVAAHRRKPSATLQQMMVEARAAYMRNHDGLAARMAEALRTGRADADGDLVTALAWEAFGDPTAVAAPAGPPAPPFRRPPPSTLAHSLLLGMWDVPLSLNDDEAIPVLRLAFETAVDHRERARLVVEQNGEVLYRISAGAESRHGSPEAVCLGGYVAGGKYRGRFLLPLRGHTDGRVTVRLDEGEERAGAMVELTEGTAVDVWPFAFRPTTPRAEPPGEIGLERESASWHVAPEVVRSAVAASRYAGTAYHLVDLSGAVNRPCDALGVTRGSFASWFGADRVEHDRVPFRIEPKVLLSGNGTENVFVLEGPGVAARRLHVLVFGYEWPKAQVPLVLRFADGEDRRVSLTLQEWTRAEPPPAFDFDNGGGFAHASIYHETIDVPRTEKITGIEGIEGRFGIVAITLEE